MWSTSLTSGSDRDQTPERETLYAALPHGADAFRKHIDRLLVGVLTTLRNFGVRLPFGKMSTTPLECNDQASARQANLETLARASQL